MADNVNHPKHYTSHPSGIECIEIARHMGFNLGNAVKYIWRADLKADAIEDLKKAIWYIQDEITKRERARKGFTETGDLPFSNCRHTTISRRETAILGTYPAKLICLDCGHYGDQPGPGVPIEWNPTKP
jgi:hypothetical protein